ncbi:MAG TPA: alpha-E domain-containing protein, partial [Chitinophagaceae bacterium]|nr:alpha-E domain-containing protein [Chitinophagaceae bacterium]
LFWLTRYMERSDCLIRVVRTNYILSFDSSSHTDFSWKDVITLFAHTNDEAVLQAGESSSSALTFLVADSKNLNSMKVLITKGRENARGVQDNITKEVWEQVNQLYHLVNQPDLDDRITGTRSLETIDLLDQSCTLFYGVTDSTMPRGQGWNFMNLGKFIERSILTIDTLNAHFSKIDHQLNAPQDILFWKNLLLSLSGYELYLKNYTRGQHNLNVIDHVIFNKEFPRSLIYSLSRFRLYLDKIADDTKMEGSAGLQKTLGRILSKVQFADINIIQEESLPHFLSSLRKDLVDFSNQLTRIYFSYA